MTMGGSIGDAGGASPVKGGELDGKLRGRRAGLNVTEVSKVRPWVARDPPCREKYIVQAS